MRTIVTLLCALPVLLSGLAAHAGELLMVGAQVMVTADPQEDSDTVVGINVVPIVIEYAATTWIGVRTNTILNLQVVGSEYDLAERGLGLTVPVYISVTAPDGRSYLGPYVSYTRNPRNDADDLTMAAEFGIRWPIADSVSLNLTLQAGATYKHRPSEDKWARHIGIYPGLGRWF